MMSGSQISKLHESVATTIQKRERLLSRSEAPPIWIVVSYIDDSGNLCGDVLGFCHKQLDHMVHPAPEPMGTAVKVAVMSYIDGQRCEADEVQDIIRTATQSLVELQALWLPPSDVVMKYLNNCFKLANLNSRSMIDCWSERYLFLDLQLDRGVLKQKGQS
ncbi:hypothetical protein AB6D11_19120 [Vibrio splendidus]